MSTERTGWVHLTCQSKSDRNVVSEAQRSQGITLQEIEASPSMQNLLVTSAQGRVGAGRDVETFRGLTQMRGADVERVEPSYNIVLPGEKVTGREDIAIAKTRKEAVEMGANRWIPERVYKEKQTAIEEHRKYLEDVRARGGQIQPDIEQAARAKALPEQLAWTTGRVGGGKQQMIEIERARKEEEARWKSLQEKARKPQRVVGI